jgi:hypothetical protein
MAARPNATRRRAARWAYAAGRAAGFSVLTGAALAILAAVVLLPEWAKLARTRHHLACTRAQTRDMEAQIEANDRAIAGVLTDPDLNKRIAIRQGALWPQNTVVALRADGQAPAPWAVTAPRSRRPPPPAGWLLNAEARLGDPRTRRGLCFVAAGLLLTGMLLFAPPRDRRDTPGST